LGKAIRSRDILDLNEVLKNIFDACLPVLEDLFADLAHIFTVHLEMAG
jgi:hypothetical protein